ncbi:sensor histidine kinase [Cryptosporangium sp. NPDC051539]|uniref:sensor histidine kinase n=1 Tax=Cryptosporangium sp. NPDC051539 TaxID=3363962 RepID=UPI00379FC38F
MRPVAKVPGQAGHAALIGFAAGLLTFLCGAPYWHHHIPAAVLTCAGSVGFAAAGGLLLDAGDSRRRVGYLLPAGAVCGSLAWTVSWNSGPWPQISFYAQGMFYVLAGYAVLSFPGGRLTGRAERGWVAFSLTVLLGGQFVVALVSPPEWNGLAPDVFWPHLTTERWVFDRVIQIVIGGQVILAAWYIALLVRRARRLSALDRPSALPVLLVTGVFGVIAAVLTAHSDAWTELDALLSFYVVLTGVATAVPLTLLSGALRERWREVDAPHRVVRMTSSTTSIGTVRDALAAALHDPRLRLLFWVPAEQNYVDRSGRAFREKTGSGRWWAEARTDEHQPLALVELDDGLRRRPGMVDAVLRAGSQALLTAQLQAVATAQLEQVLAAQARVGERETAERLRLANDLRAGAQQRLAALADHLGRLADAGLPDPSGSAAASCRDEVIATIGDLESLALGLRPAVLRTDGLGPALAEVADRLRLSVRFVVDAGRTPPAVEATTYFALCEGLTNVAKYAPGARVSVEIKVVNGWLHGTVTDDGPGGARLVPGGGLAGIDARIRALHGRTTLESVPGAGTRLHLRLPSVRSAPSGV